MPLDSDQTKLVLDRLSDELEEVARTATNPWGSAPHALKVERQLRKVTVSDFFRVEVSVSGEKELVEAVLVTGADRRPETRDYPIPSDSAQFRTLARELIQPLMFGRG